MNAFRIELMAGLKLSQKTRCKRGISVFFSQGVCSPSWTFKSVLVMQNLKLSKKSWVPLLTPEILVDFFQDRSFALEYLLIIKVMP